MHQKHMQPEALERYSFLWSEVRLAVAAVSLLIGGIPVVLVVLNVPGLVGLVGTLLKLAWVVSGAASAYLLYRYLNNGKKVFGGTDQKDVAAFFVSVVSGINLGLVGLAGTNIGMSLVSNVTLWRLAGIVYLIAAWHLYQRWQASGEKIV